MFQLDEFGKDIRSIYSTEVIFSHSKKIQQVINSFSCSMEIVIPTISTDSSWFFAYKSHFHYQYIGVCGMVIERGHKNFIYCFTHNDMGYNMILFFDRCDEDSVYQKLIRIEKLKAFL